MNTLVSLESYTSFYYYVMLVVVLITFFRSSSYSIISSKNLGSIKTMSLFLLLFVTLYMGLRPISWRFGDMTIYNDAFEKYFNGMPFNILSHDLVFEYFMYFCAQIMSASMFFFFCSLLYVIPVWFACKKWFQDYTFYAFLALITSFSFWTYGVNGIRNGIATSLFLYALSQEKLVFKIIFVLIAIGFHKSVIIPAAALALTYFYLDTKKYFYVWLLCIPLSLVAGGFFEGLFAGFMDDDRARYLTTFKEEFKDSFSNSGFRWDFLLYSGSVVYVAYFFIFKKKFDDPVYNRLVCVYLAANAFWILVIKASFSNRFAYLSWFMMGVVITYPYLTKIQIRNQHKVLGMVLLAYFGFTYLMNVILI